MADKIDKYEFVTLGRIDDPKAPPLVIREQLMPISRPGVNGVAVMRMGQRSEPFQMRSAVDVLNLNYIPIAIASYQLMIGEKAYEITWQGIDFAALFNTKYVVLDCVPIRSCKLSCRAGGLVSGSTAWLEMLWTFQPVLAS
jgi:hypothetical protein